MRSFDRRKKFGARNSFLKDTLRNPYFQKGILQSKRLRLSGWRGVLRMVGAFLIVCAAILIPFECMTHPWFTITHVEYDIAHLLPNNQATVRTLVATTLDAPRLHWFHADNLFLFPKATAEASIESTLPNRVVTITKKMPSTIHIAVREPERMFLFQTPERIAIGDTGGRALDILPAASSTDPLYESYLAQLLPITVHSMNTTTEQTSSTFSFVVGENQIPQHCATLISQLQGGLPKIQVQPVAYDISADLSTISVQTKKQWTLKTDPILSASDQIDRLSLVLHEPAYSKQEGIDYIDVRYPERVYVKPRTK